MSERMTDTLQPLNPLTYKTWMEVTLQDNPTYTKLRDTLHEVLSLGEWTLRCKNTSSSLLSPL